MGAFSLLMAPVVSRLLNTAGQQVILQAEVRGGTTLAAAVHRPLYWIMTAGFLMIALASTGLIVHFVPLLIDEGMEPRQAAGLASVIGLGVIGGRLFTGFMVDRLFAPRVAAVIMVTAALCYVVFLTGGPSFAIFGALAIGLSFGAETDLVGYMVARYFGLREYGRVFGLMYGLCTAGNGISPVLYGWVKDSSGSYQPMIVAAVALLAGSALIFAFMPPYPLWQADRPKQAAPESVAASG